MGVQSDPRKTHVISRRDLPDSRPGGGDYRLHYRAEPASRRGMIYVQDSPILGQKCFLVQSPGHAANGVEIMPATSLKYTMAIAFMGLLAAPTVGAESQDELR